MPSLRYSSAMLYVTAHAVPHDPNLMFRREMPPGCPAESFTTCSAGYLAIEDFSLIFLFLVTTTKPKSSLNDSLKSRPKVLRGNIATL